MKNLLIKRIAEKTANLLFEKKAFVFLLCCAASSFAQQAKVEFKSSDMAVQNAFSWAKAMAQRYKGNDADPVGASYEATLPARDALCMRDVSQPTIGAEIPGVNKENKNMLTL